MIKHIKAKLKLKKTLPTNKDVKKHKSSSLVNEPFNIDDESSLNLRILDQ